MTRVKINSNNGEVIAIYKNVNAPSNLENTEEYIDYNGDIPEPSYGEKLIYKDNNFLVIPDDALVSLNNSIIYKQNKIHKLENIEVLYNGIIYQGDETSQDRISRVLNGMSDSETILWKAKDNSIQTLTKEDLRIILYRAVQEQTRIWLEN